jgi:hypothetical protein
MAADILFKKESYRECQGVKKLVEHDTLHILIKWGDYWLEQEWYRYGTEVYMKYESELDPDSGYALFWEVGSALELDAGSKTGSALKPKFRSFRRSKWSHGLPWTLKMEAWKVCRLVVANLHDFDHDPDRIKVKNRIRIRIQSDAVKRGWVVQIRNRNIREFNGIINRNSHRLVGKCKVILNNFMQKKNSEECNLWRRTLYVDRWFSRDLGLDSWWVVGCGRADDR